MRKLDGTKNSILSLMGWEIPSSHSTSIPSTKRYFKMQSAYRPKGHLLANFLPCEHLLANLLTPHMLYKPQYPPPPLLLWQAKLSLPPEDWGRKRIVTNTTIEGYHHHIKNIHWPWGDKDCWVNYNHLIKSISHHHATEGLVWLNIMKMKICRKEYLTLLCCLGSNDVLCWLVGTHQTKPCSWT